MRIGIVTEYYYPTLGGIQEHVHHFALAARRLGHHVRILTPHVTDAHASTRGAGTVNRAAQDERDGVIRVGRSISLVSGGLLARASVGLGLGGRVREILRREQLDVVHVHSPLMPTLPYLALRASDAVNVGTFHSDFETSVMAQCLQPLLQRYLNRLDAAVGVSETALRGPRRYFDAPWTIIPNGVDAGFFAAGRRRPDFDDGRPNLLHVGRFDPRNGVDLVIRAWVAVRRRGVDARLILVGDGPLRPSYEAMVPADLAADAHFVGFVAGHERPAWYATGDVLLCPAVGGTFGIIALEAMAAGCALVTADTAGFRTIIQDGVQGFLVDVAQPGADEALAERAIRLLEDAALRRRLVEAGRLTAARYDWSRVTADVLALYRRLLAGERPATARLGAVA